MENAKISNLYDLNETIAKEYLEQFTYPWEALKGSTSENQQFYPGTGCVSSGRRV